MRFINIRYIIYITILLILYGCEHQPTKTLYPIEVDGLYGYIDSTGHVVIEPKYLKVTKFDHGIALVVVDSVYKFNQSSTNYSQIDTPPSKLSKEFIIKYGFINKNDQFILPPTYLYKPENNIKHIEDLNINELMFNNGLAKIKDINSDQFGFINIEGDTIIPCVYNNALKFSEGKAAVMRYIQNYPNSSLVESKWGYIDLYNNIVTDFQFDAAYSYKNNFAIVTKFSSTIDKENNNTESNSYKSRLYSLQSMVLDSNGMIINYPINNLMYELSNYSIDRIAAKIPKANFDFYNEGIQFIDEKGNVLKPFGNLTNYQIDSIKYSSNFYGVLRENYKIRDATMFSHGYAGVKLAENHWIYIDKYFCVKTEQPFQDANPFLSDLAGVKKDGKWGYIDTNFNVVIPCKFDWCGNFYKDLAEVELVDGNLNIHSYINKKGQTIWQKLIVINQENQSFKNNSYALKKIENYGRWRTDLEFNQTKNNNPLLVIIVIILTIVSIVIFINYNKTITVKNFQNFNKIESNTKSIPTVPPPHPIRKTQPIVEQSYIEENQFEDKILLINFEIPQKYIQADYGHYPIVIFPKKENIIWPHRFKSTAKKGFKDNEFTDELKKYISNRLIISNEISILIYDKTRPYEPDIAIISENDSINFKIDIEIDEPYIGSSRIPIHFIGSNDEHRDLNLLNHGWGIIRFTERQVHEESINCIALIARIINSIDSSIKVPDELLKISAPKSNKKWTKVEANEMESSNYREQYLETNRFSENDTSKDYHIIQSFSEFEKVLKEKVTPMPKEIVGERINLLDFNYKNKYPEDLEIKFNPQKHLYTFKDIEFHSVSEIVSLFFPNFNIEYWSNHIAHVKGLDPEYVKETWEAKSQKSKILGSFLHETIEKYFLRKTYNLKLNFNYQGNILNINEIVEISTEFEYFLKFIEDLKIVPFRTEWRIFDKQKLIAGTVDLVCKNGDKFIIYDWKRSEQIFRPNSNEHGFGKLSHLENTSENKYYLQQNFYKYILEKNYNITIDKMFIVILHETFGTYKIIEVPIMQKEIQYITDNFGI